ncbi:hypothetical protein [Salinispora vitiensis]|uniref:hypothetical protein n=1 Tax=Salinispora vitiensis TaxID=999544 RepID=UPI0003770F74|nr:hypothetical protein [Salinispora vitiensis]
MNQQEHTHGPELDDPGENRARPRRRWWAIGVAGMTGLALTAAGTPVATVPTTDRPSRPTTDRSSRSANDRPPGWELRADGDGAGQDGRNNRGEGKPGGTPVPCDADRLIAEITQANARGGAVLDLERDCTYLLTADLDGSGLPAITTPITLNGGKNTTIERAAAADQFRILTVNAGGDLTLNHLTITGGHTNGAGGGGILVNAGGTLAANDSTVTRNVTVGNGGGIRNAGTTAVTRSHVSRNTANQLGGGIESTGRLELVKSQVDDNSALLAGGVFAPGVTIRAGSISGNHATSAVGGLFVQGGVSTVVGTRIAGNTAIIVGGAAVTGNGELTLQHVKLVENTANVVGGLFVQGGGVSGTTAVVADSVIEKNVSTANIAGGVFNAGQTVARRTKITDNHALLGGGIFNTGTGTLTLDATKVVKNIAVTDGGGIFNDGTVELNTATGTIVVKNRPNNCVNVPGCSG